MVVLAAAPVVDVVLVTITVLDGVLVAAAPRARKRVESAWDTRFRLAVKQRPSLVMTCATARDIPSRRMASPVGIAICCLRTLLPAFTASCPRPVGPPCARMLRTPFDAASLSRYR
jgi:hypothetical protein